ncbi:S-layer homology domain-containing protein [Sporosarcina sp. P1]|uniref:S-layer homology domain-containing protein n=1 Tax=Sporosarcina sp. P1 TaxID=2048257 RepID=UPI000C16A321|nr:S-layer homology domain-containing protein [Sporosarcina sp. P1]PIC82526.1 hypothetical protein CSV73_11920 [Sporosarcina sp. P1]
MPVSPSFAEQPMPIYENQATQTLQHSITISPTEVPMPLSTVAVEEGDTVLSVLKRSVKANNISMSYRGGEHESAYVEGIQGVFEFDRGQGSGWMYSVNGIFPNRGAGVIKLIPGDKVEWKYTIDLGKDLNADLFPFREDLEPKISVSGVTSGATVTQSALSFQVNAASYFGTALQPTVTVNGKPAVVTGNTVNTVLQSGENNIVLKATDKKDDTVTKTVKVTYAPNTNPEPNPLPNPEPNPNPPPEPPVVKPDPKPEPESPSIKDYSKLVNSAISQASAQMLAGPIDSEWQAIGLVKAGKKVPASYTKEFYEHLQDQVISRSGKGRMKITDVQRLTMAASAIGIDPTNADGKGFNLIDKIVNSEKHMTGADSLTYQGNNGIIFALIALDSRDYQVPNNSKWTREKLVAELLKYQKDDGSWSLATSKEGSTSYDITAMALIGIAPYTDQPEVRKAMDRAVKFLANAQGPTGGFDEAFVGGISSEATSQVIIGLTANQIDPRIPMFTKNGINLIDHLLSFQTSDGGFQHTAGDSRSNAMATEQALQALVAFDLFTKGKGVLYNFKDVPVLPAPKPDPVPTPDPDPKPDPKPDPMPDPTPTPQFTDITTHWAKDYITQAVEQGIASGYKDNTFKPNQSLTRAQAVSILVRALDLKTDKKAPFVDTQKYAASTQAEIAAAYHNGLIKGIDGKFMPTQQVTRAQMALMLYRAYEVKNGEVYKFKQVAPFRDIHSYNMEAVKAMSMLYDLKMANGENGKFMPSNSTSRAHAMKMLIEFLNTK